MSLTFESSIMRFWFTTFGHHLTCDHTSQFILFITRNFNLKSLDLNRSHRSLRFLVPYKESFVCIHIVFIAGIHNSFCLLWNLIGISVNLHVLSVAITTLHESCGTKQCAKKSKHLIYLCLPDLAWKLKYK